MIVKKKKSNKIRLDLTGPDGNAHVLIGVAIQICRANKIDSKPIVKEMMSGDYEHLVSTLDEYFGSVLILER